jgi:hypothetical protein
MYFAEGPLESNKFSCMHEITSSLSLGELPFAGRHARNRANRSMDKHVLVNTST